MLPLEETQERPATMHFVAGRSCASSEKLTTLGSTCEVDPGCFNCLRMYFPLEPLELASLAPRAGSVNVNLRSSTVSAFAAPAPAPAPAPAAAAS